MKEQLVATINQMIDSADQVFDSPEVQGRLADFFELKNLIEQAEQVIKEKIERAGLHRSPDFKVDSERVKITYPAYGKKYTIDEEKLPTIPKELYRIEMKCNPDSKAIDEFVQRYHGLPEGITPAQRKKSVRITIKK